MHIRLHASIGVGLLSFVAVAGCSRRPAEPPDAGVKTEVQETANSKQSADTAEAKAKDAAMSVKNLGASSEAFRIMISQNQIKPKQASGYQTHSE